VTFVTCDLTSAAKAAKVASGACDLNALLTKVKPSTLLPVEQVMANVRDTIARSATGAIPALNVGGANIKLSYAADNDPGAYFSFVPRVVPENVTLLAKTGPVPGGADWSERVVPLKRGETVGSILRELGATPEEIKSIITVIGPAAVDPSAKEGQKVRALLAAAGLGHMQPLRVIVAGDNGITAAVALSDLGKYVPVDIRNIDTATAEASDDQSADDGSGVRLYQSIYETALRNQVPRPVIDDLIRVYSYDVDFQRKVQPGDSFDVFFAGEDEGSNSEKSEVLFASLTVGGETKKYYRFQTPDDSVVDYYDETGKSAKKFLVRKPVNNAIMRSGFGSRRHPILGYVKMHTGVDWATPYGTPIFASGNGVVESVGWEGGYGKYVKLKHNNGYQTAYGHMSAYAKGLEVGKRVRQGQVIGFVGSTGQSTGAHVHYEILVNGRFVDPMRIKLPRGRSLEGPVLAGFEKERNRLDTMMNNRGGAAARVSDAAGTGGVRQTSTR
jgi:murein DD-endopeptidase MepM/ murein hydrolase activator NlpD